MSTARKVTRLSQNLAHDNPIVRCAALAALTARFQPEDVFPVCAQIAVCLEDETWEVRVAACQTFRELGTARFRAAAKEEEEEAAAAEAVEGPAGGAALGSATKRKVATSGVAVQQAHAERMLARIDVEGDPPRNPAQLRLWILARAGRPRRPLRAPDETYDPSTLDDIDELRAECEARALDSEGFAPMLRMRLGRHKEDQVYTASVWVPQISVCLSDRDKRVRTAAIECLNQLGDDIVGDYAPAIAARLHDTSEGTVSWRNRNAACDLLVDMGRDVAVLYEAGFEELLRDEDFAVRNTAAAALRGLNPDAHTGDVVVPGRRRRIAK
jgi:HEAT repeat protein